MTKLNKEAREQIRRIYAQGRYSQQDIAVSFGISQPAVSRICRGYSLDDISDEELIKAGYKVIHFDNRRKILKQ